MAAGTIGTGGGIGIEIGITTATGTGIETGIAAGKVMFMFRPESTLIPGPIHMAVAIMADRTADTMVAPSVDTTVAAAETLDIGSKKDIETGLIEAGKTLVAAGIPLPTTPSISEMGMPHTGRDLHAGIKWVTGSMEAVIAASDISGNL